MAATRAGAWIDPGLKRLLADVASGHVDVIVVYKVDRLTRSLADFARIVEVLDERSASFVSITQALNSTTSMGRLTLNVLLSFAQFEREVTGERIRDKIAASKKKGIFMGGPLPIGYDVRERKLVINDGEAAIVRHIFERYAALGCGREVLEELRADGIRTKVRELAGGRVTGGVPFERGSLFHLLGNPIYIGKVVHKDVEHEGEHEGIIPPALWTRVQQQIADNRVNRTRTKNSDNISLLAGVLRDGHDRRMSPSHAVKKGKRYRYYVTYAAELRSGEPQAWRMPATDLEASVVDRLTAYVRDYRAIAELVGAGASATQISGLVERAAHVAEQLATTAGRRLVLVRLLTRVQVRDDGIVVTIDRQMLHRLLELPPCDDDHLELTAEVTKVRTGKATRLVLTDVTTPTGRDPKLIALLAEARATRDLVLASPDRSLRQLGADHQRCRHRMAKLIRLSWLAPDSAAAIVEGRQPRWLTPRRLLEDELPIGWDEQDSLLTREVSRRQ